MLFESLRTQQTYLTGTPWLPPTRIYLGNFSSVLEEGFFRYFLNSIIVAVLTLIILLLCAVLGSYAFVRMKSKGTERVFTLFLSGLAIPVQAAIIPLYAIVEKMGLYNTLWAIILPSAAFALPLSILILVNFVRDIPTELYEAMILEGVGEWGLLLRLTIPLARPAVTAVVIYNFVQVWNNFLFPLVMTESPNLQTLPLALEHFQGQYTMNVPAILASVLLSAVPLIAAYIVARRQLLAGLTAGFSR